MLSFEPYETQLQRGLGKRYKRVRTVRGLNDTLLDEKYEDENKKEL